MTDYPRIEHEIITHVRHIFDAHSGISEIWFIGSRANGSAKNDSDWDFFAFAAPSVLDALRQDIAFRRPDVDLLIVTDGDSFESPWERYDLPGEFKRGHLFDRRDPTFECDSCGWGWTRMDNDLATYVTSSLAPGGFRTLKAFRIFHRGTYNA